MSKSDSVVNFVVKYFAVIIFAGWMLSVVGCAGMSIEYPTPNCVDYVQANKVSTDVINFGDYTPVTKFSHVWIERDGTCFDNMNQGGFNCDSELYKTTLLIDPSDNLKMLRLLCKRPAVNGYKSCEVKS